MKKLKLRKINKVHVSTEEIYKQEMMDENRNLLLLTLQLSSSGCFRMKMILKSL
jgi:hypothetical protein